MPLTLGMAASVTRKIEDTDTAIAFRSGDVAVIATPRVVALAEEATVIAVTDALPPGRTTVGAVIRNDYELYLALGLPKDRALARAAKKGWSRCQRGSKTSDRGPEEGTAIDSCFGTRFLTAHRHPRGWNCL